MLSREPTHDECGKIACGIRSACDGDFTGCSTFSRTSASSSGPFVSTMSNSKRLLRVSVSARCITFSELARQTFALTPYFFSNASVSAFMSSTGADV